MHPVDVIVVDEAFVRDISYLAHWAMFALHVIMLTTTMTLTFVVCSPRRRSQVVTVGATPVGPSEEQKV